MIRLKYFHDSLNIAVILASGREFVSTKCIQFPFNIYRIKLNDEHFFCRAAIIHFWDKPYQEMNFKIHLNTVIVCK